MNPGVEVTQDRRTETILITLGIRNSSELDLLLQHITVNGQCQQLVDRDKLINHLIEYAKELKKRRDQSQNQTNQQKTEQSNKQGIWSLEDVTKFWKELGQIACTQKATTWNMLEQTLKRYQEVLMGRVDLVSRNDELASQNEELRGLLQQYVEGEKRDLGNAQMEQVGQQIGNKNSRMAARK
ncbi:Conserved_hypothetical protein [Hexamita inflata]|nr:Conserved hypothetical protein [Hexamita inflata]